MAESKRELRTWELSLGYECGTKAKLEGKMPSENVRTGVDTGSGGTAVTVTEGHEKPYHNKHSSLTKTNVDTPIEHGARAQIEIYSDMGRERTGIFYSPEGNYASPEVWGDRKFAANDRIHPNAKPQDTGH